jgi:hypothetical protein
MSGLREPGPAFNNAATMDGVLSLSAASTEEQFGRALAVLRDRPSMIVDAAKTAATR